MDRITQLKTELDDIYIQLNALFDINIKYDDGQSDVAAFQYSRLELAILIEILITLSERITVKYHTVSGAFIFRRMASMTPARCGYTASVSNLKRTIDETNFDQTGNNLTVIAARNNSKLVRKTDFESRIPRLYVERVRGAVHHDFETDNSLIVGRVYGLLAYALVYLYGSEFILNGLRGDRLMQQIISCNKWAPENIMKWFRESKSPAIQIYKHKYKDIFTT